MTGPALEEGGRDDLPRQPSAPRKRSGARMASSLRRRRSSMLFLALDPGKVWRDIGSSGPAPLSTIVRTARKA